MAVVGLVHGLGGTAATMQPLADALASFGHETVTITLPGHGTDPSDLVGVVWADWLAAVPDADALVGQSMGATLALAAAGAHRRVRGVVAINPPAADADALEGLEWRLSRGHDWVDAPELAHGEVGYTRLPLTALVQMVEGTLRVSLADVTAPVLLVTSADDDVVDPESAGTIGQALGGSVVRLSLPRGGHVATLGPNADLLAAATAEFLAAI